MPGTQQVHAKLTVSPQPYCPNHIQSNPLPRSPYRDQVTTIQPRLSSFQKSLCTPPLLKSTPGSLLSSGLVPFPQWAPGPPAPTMLTALTQPHALTLTLVLTHAQDATSGGRSCQPSAHALPSPVPECPLPGPREGGQRRGGRKDSSWRRQN